VVGEGDTVVWVLECRDERIECGAGYLPCQTENRVRRTRYRSDIEMVAGERGKNVLDGAEQVVNLAGGREPEIEWGHGISPAKPKTDAMCSVLVWYLNRARGVWWKYVEWV